MKLSIVIPVFNEAKTILDILKTVARVKLPAKIKQRELIVVDDCSNDGTRQILEKLKMKGVKTFFHEKNTGKGGALKTGFARAIGDIILIQDADMEYNPNEYSKLLRLILENKADVVYGSRFVGGDEHRILYYWHTLGNKVLTWLSNMFTDLNLTDMETCYKVFRKDVIKKVDIRETGFGFEPEITAKIANLCRRDGVRIYEVGISYHGRTYEEGKKIRLKDAFRALWCILIYNSTTFASIVKYFINGVFVLLVQLVSLYILIRHLEFQDKQNLANLISIEVSVIVGFILHSKITWHTNSSETGDVLTKLFLFHFVTSFSALIRLGLFHILMKYNVHYILNAVTGLAIAAIFNFLGYDRIVFRKAYNKLQNN